MEAGPTVLVVDDSPAARHVLSRLMSQLGWSRIIEADNGRDAARWLSQGGIDCVISDWNMPGMSGFELLCQVRADPQLHGVPFIMLTGEADRSYLLRALRAGTDGYLHKPFTVQGLELALHYALASAARRSPVPPAARGPQSRAA